MSSSTVLAPPVTTAAFLNVAENAAATLIGITAPTDPNGYTAAQLGVTLTAVPNDGTVLLNGAAVTVGETLSAAQLAALDFAPTVGAYSQTSPFGYTVTDPSGATAEGTASLTIGPATGGRVLTVGAGQEYATLAAAVAASQNGDTIEVQAGTYVNDFAQINTDITIEGVGGMAVFEATESIPNDKAILVTDGNVTIDNLEFTGATVADGNGAGIRYETGDLILNNDNFSNNQEGLLAATNPTGNLLITNSEFDHNGAGDGSTHNIYIGGDINSFTADDSYFHDAVVGHEIKSRAANTYIYNSRIFDLSGTASYSIDLPNGGNAILAGNVIQQGPNSQNPDMVAYGEEGSLYAAGSLQMYGNMLLNNLTSGTPLGVWNDTSITAQLANTQIYGLTAAEVASGPVTQTGDTFLTTEPSLTGGPSPATLQQVLDNFGWAQGWGSPDNPRMIADVTGSGTSDYVGFGDQYTFIAYGGTFANGGQTGPGFSPAVASVRDFGTDEGYTASAQRGAAAVGVGDGDILYGQGFAGIYWYAATGETPQTDAAGNTYDVLQYQTSPNFYGNFGTAQGWTPANGFEILKTTASDGYASILGFGDAGIVVGPQAFAPGATAASSYVIPFAAGNNSGWSQETDIRTFTDTNGNPIDLNGDGIADFVGMGPQGLAFAYGNDNGPNGSYELGPLQNAQINGTSDSLGDAQGWNDATSVRYIVPDAQTGHDDIIAFGAAGVYVSMGQNPAANNGQPFGQLYLAMADLGTDQGWTSQTPRLIGDVTGDGIPDIVGFGDASTFVATGSHNTNGQLVFTMDPSLTIPDFGVTEGWSGSNPQTLRALAQLPGSSQTDLVLSGAANTQTWQFA